MSRKELEELRDQLTTIRDSGAPIDRNDPRADIHDKLEKIDKALYNMDQSDAYGRQAVEQGFKELRAKQEADAKAAREAREAKERADAEAKAANEARPTESNALEYEARAVPGAAPGSDASDAFGGQKRADGLDKATEAVAAKAMTEGLWWQKQTDDDGPAADEDPPSLDYTPMAIPGANRGPDVDEDDVFGGTPTPPPATAGGVPRALIGVGVGVVLLVLAGVAMLRSGPSQTDAGAIPQTTSAAATAAPVSFGGGTYGPLRVTRGQGSSISLYQLAATGPLPGSSVKWTIDAPCGELAPLTASAQVSWSFDNNTKTCPPAGGPYPGTVKVTFTASDGKTYTWSAGSETGSYGETVTVR